MRSSDDRDQARLLTTGRSSEARERLAGSLQRAFPLPKSGQFTDLLDALAGGVSAGAPPRKARILKRISHR